MDAQTELIRRIASVVGHELRNPMAVINNSAYFIKAKLGSGGSLDPKVEKHLGIVASEIARADRMLADMLAFSRALELSSGPLALGALVQEAVDGLPKSGVKVSIKSPKAAVQAVGDKQRLADVVRRLLENAVEAVGDGGVVTATVSREKDMACVEVRDGGPGIKPEILPHLFEPFRTGKPRGLGLSLAIARKVVEAHKGRIEGGNAKEGGARFKLALPAA